MKKADCVSSAALFCLFSWLSFCFIQLLGIMGEDSDKSVTHQLTTLNSIVDQPQPTGPSA